MLKNDKQFTFYDEKNRVLSVLNLVHFDNTYISLSEILLEWELFKSFLSAHCRTTNFENTIGFISKINFVKNNVACYRIILLVFSVNCERYFSMMNPAKFKLRNQIYICIHKKCE